MWLNKEAVPRSPHLRTRHSGILLLIQAGPPLIFRSFLGKARTIFEKYYWQAENVERTQFATLWSVQVPEKCLCFAFLDKKTY